MEENLRRSMLLSDGDPSVFITRPISCGFMVATVALLLLFTLPALRRKRKELSPQRASKAAELAERVTLAVLFAPKNRQSSPGVKKTGARAEANFVIRRVPRRSLL
jgi:hypothetical protein